MKGKQLVHLYQKIWDEYQYSQINSRTNNNFDNLLDRGFVFQFDEEIVNPDILFIGINPSYNGKKETSNFYTKAQTSAHPYFKPFSDIETELNEIYDRVISWTHIDLLVFRETQQAFIKDVLLKKRNPEGIDFVYKQLMISRSIIEYFNPKLIVISNALARKFLGYEKTTHNGKAYNVWMDFSFKFDQNKGTSQLNSKTNKDFKPHCFFTSMLSGQRALDIGSRERLVWHIDYVLRKLEKDNRTKF